MVQKLTENSALSLKIGQVHSVHTQLTLVARLVRPGCEPLRSGREGWAVSWPCCSPRSTVSQALAAVSWPYRADKLRVSQPWLYCIATQPMTIPHCPLSRYSQLYRDTPIQTIRLSRYKKLYRDTLSPACQASPVTIQLIVS